jgi:uncharacterized protein (TIGR02145 family)
LPVIIALKAELQRIQKQRMDEETAKINASLTKVDEYLTLERFSEAKNTIKLAQDNSLPADAAANIRLKQKLSEVEKKETDFLIRNGKLLQYRGENYTLQTIGSQVWMTENLHADKFRNGDPIPEAKTTEEWIKAANEGKPAWCYFDNNSKNGATYGKLYNWYAVNDSRGLAPEGWRVASDADWTNIIQSYGGAQAAHKKLSSVDLWKKGQGGTNESGLTIIPTGLRLAEGNFQFIGEYGVYWSSTQENNLNALYRYFNWPNGSVTRYAHGKGLGLAVRCIKNTP